MKITEEKGVRMRSLVRHFGGRGRARLIGCELGRVTSKSINHMDMHKPNNKLGNA